MDIIINASTELVPTASLFSYNDWLHNFLACVSEEVSFDFPLGDFLRQYHGLKGDWVVVTPIHWEVTHNDAMIVALGSDFHLTEEEAQRWYEVLKAFFAEEGSTLLYHNESTWLLQRKNAKELLSPAPHTLRHRSLLPFLAKLDKTGSWQKLITEAQMFLNTHPLNRSRPAGTTINGVWFYGGGSFSVLAPCLKFSGGRHSSSISILTDDEKLLLAFPSLMKPLSFDKKLAVDAILLINNLNVISKETISTLEKRATIRWFWNNTAYLTKKITYFKRLRRRIDAYLTKSPS